MSWQGKLFGGSIGMMFGPWGAAAGAAAGHFFVDRKQGRELRKKQQRLLGLAAGAFYELSVVDGALRPEEERLTMQFLSELNHLFGDILPSRDLPMLFENTRSIDHCGDRFSQEVQSDPALAEHFFLWMLRIGVCDANLGQRETLYLRRRADNLRLSAQTVERMFTLYVRGEGSRTADAIARHAAAETLGVSEDAEAETLKKAYRVQSMKYHPDHHADLSPEILNLATERFTKIQDAYRLLSGSEPLLSSPSFCLSPEEPRFTPAEGGVVARCLVCGGQARFPAKSAPLLARCPACQARLAFLREELDSLNA